MSMLTSDVASEMAKEVAEMIITEQRGGLSGGLKGSHPNPSDKCANNSGVVLGRVNSSQVDISHVPSPFACVTERLHMRFG